MTTDDQLIHIGARPLASRGLAASLRSVGVHDWLVLSYLALLNLAVVGAPAGPAKVECVTRMLLLLSAELAAVVVVRGGFLKHRFTCALLYRLAIFGTVQLSYFFLADLLPLVRPISLDFELHALDLKLFGVEPAMALDRVVSPITTEWFAFFYYGYFFLLALHVIPLLLFARQPRIVSEFSLGLLVVFCVGHILYMVVPGFGPYHAMAEQFAHPFPQGLWLDTVMTTVAEGGAQKDIFPSLHTAAPMFIALFSYRNRHLLPFRYTWVPVVFMALNIIIATMFLRWHYVIDVVAGLVLAVVAWLLSVHVTTWEARRRIEHGLQAPWPAY
ncbi:MAG: phosphatase PAP2 family protein [Polyangiaceae bacterium]|nr:phosphatase PAP2 family protein [Polyangiaceae bacterium]